MTPTPAGSGQEVAYEFKDVPIPLSGGLLLGEGFIQELYAHMGFHPAWKCLHVIELIFEGGQLHKRTQPERACG